MNRILLIAALLILAGSSIAATLTPQLGGGIGQFDGGISSSTSTRSLTNLRITNTGAFRITNTSANRAVYP